MLSVPSSERVPPLILRLMTSEPESFEPESFGPPGMADGGQVWIPVLRRDDGDKKSRMAATTLTEILTEIRKQLVGGDGRQSAAKLGVCLNRGANFGKILDCDCYREDISGCCRLVRVA